jgi:hypothetical protein
MSPYFILLFLWKLKPEERQSLLAARRLYKGALGRG